MCTLFLELSSRGGTEKGFVGEGLVSGSLEVSWSASLGTEKNLPTSGKRGLLLGLEVPEAPESAKPAFELTLQSTALQCALEDITKATQMGRTTKYAIPMATATARSSKFRQHGQAFCRRVDLLDCTVLYVFSRIAPMHVVSFCLQ